jgi:2-dehydro-3-deoxyphosphogalactonate aldolase
MTSESASPAPPLVAILRGVTPEQIAAVATTLYQAGIRIIEVPLNSPQPFASIQILAKLALPDCLIGAGTVLTTSEVQRTFDAGGRLMVAPNCSAAVIGSALRLGMTAMPGIATATEAFAAIDAGATTLKLFPAASYGPAHLKALKTVLPAAVRVFPVGGIGAADIGSWAAAGADGYGFGSEIYRPDYSIAQIASRAQQLLASLAAAQAPRRGVG